MFCTNNFVFKWTLLATMPQQTARVKGCLNWWSRNECDERDFFFFWWWWWGRGGDGTWTYGEVVAQKGKAISLGWMQFVRWGQSLPYAAFYKKKKGLASQPCWIPSWWQLSYWMSKKCNVYDQCSQESCSISKFLPLTMA